MVGVLAKPAVQATIAKVINTHAGQKLAEEAVRFVKYNPSRNPFSFFADKTSAARSAGVGAEGTGAYLRTERSSIQGLSKLEGCSVRVSQKGLDLVKRHLSQFGTVKENELMLQRIDLALKANQPLTGADASFYIHEATEATKMLKGMEYAKAHQFALNKYKVSPYSVYHPDVINQVNMLEHGSFNSNWIEFWNTYKPVLDSKRRIV